MKFLIFLMTVMALIAFTNSVRAQVPIIDIDSSITEDLGGGVTKIYKKNGENYSELGYISGGFKNGVWIKYYDGDNAGMIKTASSYSNGVLNGPQFEYSRRGQIEQETNFANGKKNGLYVKYKFGRPVEKMYFANDKLDGASTYFQNGNIQRIVNFKDGIQHGAMMWYDEKGKLVMEYEYENGKKVKGSIVGSTDNILPIVETNANNVTKDGAPNIQAGPITSIEFEVTSYDFGTVTEGEKVKHIYNFKNTGVEPLFIFDVIPSCGCLVSQWPKEPISPGNSGEMIVELNTKNKGKVGGWSQTMRLTIKANTHPIISYLSIRANVERSAIQQAEKDAAAADRRNATKGK